MKCFRCQGLLVRQTFSDFFRIFHALRCFNCGVIIDRTIAANRREAAGAAAEPAKITRRWIRRSPIAVSR